MTTITSTNRPAHGSRSASKRTCILLTLLAALLHAPLFAAQETPVPDVTVATATPDSFLNGKRVLSLGDSITQDGRYISFLEYFLNLAYPKDQFDIISIGLASETVSGLSEKTHPFPRPCALERLGRAIEKTKPDYIIASYGMNDGIYHPPSPERLKAFQNGVNTLLAAARAAHAKVILLTSTPFDPVPVRNNTRKSTAADFSYAAPYENYDDALVQFSNWELTLHAPDLLVIDLHTPLADYLKTRRKTDPGFRFSGDGIHPSPAGHLLMAQTILAKLGVTIEIKDLDRAADDLGKDPLFALVKQHRETRSQGWLPYVGYTRGSKVSAPDVDAAEKHAAELQAQIDQLRQK